MTASRTKTLPWILGVAVAAVSLVAANRLLHPDGNPAPSGGAAHPQPAPPGNGTPLLCQGVVDTETPTVYMGLSSALPQGLVAEVLAAEGKEVKPGDPLLRFDDRLAQKDFQKAEAAFYAASVQQQLAQAAQQDHARKLELQNLAVQSAEAELKRARDSRVTFRGVFDRAANINKADPTYRRSPEEQTRDFNEREDIVKLDALIEQLGFKVQREKIELDRLRADPVDNKAQLAGWQVKAAEHERDKAKLVVDKCVVRAEVAGTVERVDVAPGMVLGPAARTPAITIVPAGKRLVRAEVLAEFAHRLGNRIGGKAVITDESNPSLSYEGRLVRVPTAYLPKRSAGGEVLTAAPARVLEAVVEVLDPAPAGRPPLLVGQPVRVSFQ